MPNFYLALTAQAMNNSVHVGNTVMKTLTALPEIADFEEAKIDYCKALQLKGVMTTPENTVITMCVPCS